MAEETAVPADVKPPEPPAAVAAPVMPYQFAGMEIVGDAVFVTVKAPSGGLFKGTVSQWQKVTAVEVPK